MNRQDWVNAKSKKGLTVNMYRCRDYWKPVMEQMRLDRPGVRVEIHHLNETEEQRQFNELYYELWDINYTIPIYQDEHRKLDITREKQSRAQKGKKPKNLNDIQKAHNKRIRCVETGEIFESVTAAILKYPKAQNCDNVALGKRNFAGELNGVKLTWKWVDSESKLYVKKIRGIKFICDQTGERFESLQDAAKRFNTYPNNIAHVIHGKRKDYNGYTFSILKDNK
jgi:hypothetical protein